MAHVIVVGDGPGGLSAALFLAKNGQEVTVYGQDKTAMNHAHLYNYLGIPEIGGTEFQAIARQQVSWCRGNDQGRGGHLGDHQRDFHCGVGVRINPRRLFDPHRGQEPRPSEILGGCRG